MSDHLFNHFFEVIGQSHGTFNSHIARFEATFWRVTNSNQHLRCLLLKAAWWHCQDLMDHPVISDLILDSIKIYQHAYVLISYHIQNEKTRSLWGVASAQSQFSKRWQLGLPKAKKRRIDGDNKDQASALPVLTTSLVLIYQANRIKISGNILPEWRLPSKSVTQLGTVTTTTTLGTTPMIAKCRGTISEGWL